MATFLLTTMPSDDLGLVVRSLPIGRALEARGHRVLCCNPAPAPRALIAGAGFENALPDHPLYDVLAAPRSLGGALAAVRARARREGGRAAWRLPVEVLRALPLRRAPPAPETWSMDHAGAQLGLADPGFVRASVAALRGLLRARRPDVVVDFWNPLAVMAARAEGVPVATVIQADAHPLSRGFVWWKPPPPGVPTAVPVINAELRRLGLAPVDRLEALSVGDLTLAVGSPELEPLPPHAGVTWIGLALWEPPDAALPAWLDDLGRERPLAWVYSGNPRYGLPGDALDSAVVLEACVEALAGTWIDVVLTTGHHPLPRGLGALPPNFRHAPFLPGQALAARADLLVHHGGYGSCQAGLAAGKPAVIIPTYSERESNARRLASRGAAALVEVTRRDGRKAVDAAALRRAVREVLADPRFAARARALGDGLRALGGPPRAAALIEAL